MSTQQESTTHESTVVESVAGVVSEEPPQDVSPKQRTITEE